MPSVLLLSWCALLSYAQTNAIDKTIHSPASIQIQTISFDKPISGHLYEFTYNLSLARELGFRNAVELIEQEKYQEALQAIQDIIGSGFSLNKEATNGYLFGFFSEALIGICQEKMGEVVKTYRSYQNARQYCDKEVASLSFPGPKLEVFVGIGRMCSRAGREYDALAYLDTARMEGMFRKGINNDQGVHDPLVDCFLGYLSLADVEDIEMFYYLVEWACPAWLTC